MLGGGGGGGSGVWIQSGSNFPRGCRTSVLEPPSSGEPAPPSASRLKSQSRVNSPYLIHILLQHQQVDEKRKKSLFVFFSAAALTSFICMRRIFNNDNEAKGSKKGLLVFFLIFFLSIQIDSRRQSCSCLFVNGKNYKHGLMSNNHTNQKVGETFSVTRENMSVI